MCRRPRRRRGHRARAADDGLRPGRVVLLLAELTSFRAMAPREPVARSAAPATRIGRRPATVGEARRTDGDVDRRPAVVRRPCRHALGRRTWHNRVGMRGNSVDSVRSAYRAGARQRDVPARDAETMIQTRRRVELTGTHPSPADRACASRPFALQRHFYAPRRSDHDSTQIGGSSGQIRLEGVCQTRSRSAGRRTECRIGRDLSSARVGCARSWLRRAPSPTRRVKLNDVHAFSVAVKRRLCRGSRCCLPACSRRT